MLPSNSPMFIRASRLHNELFTRELECTRQVFADKAPHQCDLDVESKGVGAFVDFMCAKGGLVAALRILLRPSRGLCLRVTFHDLDRHVGIACEDKQPSRVGPVNFSVRALPFERGQPPRSDKPVLDGLGSTAILAAGHDASEHVRGPPPLQLRPPARFQQPGYREFTFCTVINVSRQHQRSRAELYRGASLKLDAPSASSVGDTSRRTPRKGSLKGQKDE